MGIFWNFIILFMLGLLLSMGMIVNITVIGEESKATGSKDNVTTDVWDADTSEFKTQIQFVGTSFLDKDEVQPAGIIENTPYYNIETDILELTSITLKADLSGYNSWNLGKQNLDVNISQTVPLNETYSDVYYPPAYSYNQTIDFGLTSRTVGQGFVIANGNIRILNFQELTDAGIVVALPLGDHPITILYISMTQDGQFVYSQDTVLIRLRLSDDIFTDVIDRSLSVNTNILDLYEDRTINAKVIEYLPYLWLYERNIKFNPNPQLSLSLRENLEEKAIENNEKYILSNPNMEELLITGTTNTTGFDGLQILDQWDSVQGISFIWDYQGVHELDGLTSLSIIEGTNAIGIISLAPYGIWHSKIQDATTTWRSIVDWDGFGEYGKSVFDPLVNSSIDFSVGMSSIRFIVSLEDSIETETVTRQEKVGLRFAEYLTTIVLLTVTIRLWRRKK